MVYIVFGLGLILGSFFNVVGIRVPRGESIVHPRSHCTTCDRDLSPMELVPVLSYVIQYGRCKGCGTRVSPIYPAIELITGLVFIQGYLTYGLGLDFVFHLALFSLLIILVVSDLRYQLVPNSILIIFSVLLIPLSLFGGSVEFKSQIIGFILAFVASWSMIKASKGRGIGGGDLKLFLIFAFILGYEMFIGLFFLSVVIGLFHGLINKWILKTNVIPFIPSIALATFITLTTDNYIYTWYVSDILGLM